MEYLNLIENNSPKLLENLSTPIGKTITEIIGNFSVKPSFHTLNCVHFDFEDKTCFGYEFENGFCMASYFYFPYWINTEKMITLCNENYIREENHSWLKKISGRLSVQFLYHEIVITPQNENAKAFQCYIPY